MSLFSAIRLSLNGLRTNKKRSFLTMLGIIIGVGSVIVIISVGAGAQSLIINELSSFGTDIFAVTPGAAQEDGPPASVMGITVTTLKLEEVDDLKKIPHVIAVTPYVRGIDTATYQNQKTEATFLGVNADFLSVETGAVIAGRFFTEEDVRSMAKVAVLGQTAKLDLFGESDAIGQDIKIKKHNFKVIGVREPLGTVAFENKDEQIYLPVTTVQKLLLGINHISLIRGKVDKSENLPYVLESVSATIRENHHITNPEYDDFSARSIDQALDVIGSVTDAIRFFLVGIAAISLLVGGIGIMNIMLVNVTERTKEIGLRKSVGATRSNILRQFLAESTTITLFGGLLGIIGGVLFSWLVALGASVAGFNWDFIVTIPSILLGLTVSVAVGIIFGSYPANKAAKLEPIEALRAE